MEGSNKARIDPIKEAINIFTKIVEIVERIDAAKDREKVGSKIRTRAREIPSFLSEIGLIPTLSFCYSKTEQEILKLVHEAWTKNQGQNLTNELRKKNEDKVAYSLYLIAMLEYLQRVFGEELVKDVCNPHVVLKRLCEKSLFGKKILERFLIEFKKLCEAYWKAEER